MFSPPEVSQHVVQSHHLVQNTWKKTSNALRKYQVWHQRCVWHVYTYDTCALTARVQLWHVCTYDTWALMARVQLRHVSTYGTCELWHVCTYDTWELMARVQLRHVSTYGTCELWHVCTYGTCGRQETYPDGFEEENARIRDHLEYLQIHRRITLSPISRKWDGGI
jgi:hypothetical protein